VKKETLSLADLPEDWRDFSQMWATQEIGRRWAAGNRSVVLEVPSSIVQEEVNYLLNPLHPDFKNIRLIKTEPFVFDQRIKFN